MLAQDTETSSGSAKATSSTNRARDLGKGKRLYARVPIRVAIAERIAEARHAARMIANIGKPQTYPYSDVSSRDAEANKKQAHAKGAIIERLARSIEMRRIILV